MTQSMEIIPRTRKHEPPTLRTHIEDDAMEFALLTRWRDGDAAAGEDLLSGCRARFHRICTRSGIRSEDVLLEIFQDVVLRTLKELPGLPDRIDRSFGGWFTWQVRDAISRWRRQNREVEDLPTALAIEESNAGRGAEAWEAIQHCASLLPEGEREIFDLRFLKERSVAETALALNKTANAVSQAIFRLSRRLRACLERWGLSLEEVTA